MNTKETYAQSIKRIKELKKLIHEKQQEVKDLIKITESLEIHIFRIGRNTTGEYIFLYSEGKIPEKNKITTRNVKGKSVKYIFGDKLFSELKPYFDKAFNGKTVKYRGFIYKNRYHSTVITPYKKNNDGEIIEISGNTQDVNELYEIEKKFKEKTEVLDNIIEYNPYSIQVCDGRGYTKMFNKAFIDIFKIAPGKDWCLFEDPLLNRLGLSNEILKIKDGEIVEIPEKWYNPHEISPENPDNLRCLKTIHFPIYNTRNELENIIIMHEDITSKVNLKDRIKELEEFQELSVGREIILNKLESELEKLKTKISNGTEGKI
jgi:hypothetical protein